MPAVEELIQRLARLKDDLPEVQALDLGLVLAGAEGAEVLRATGRVAPVARRAQRLVHPPDGRSDQHRRHAHPGHPPRPQVTPPPSCQVLRPESPGLRVPAGARTRLPEGASCKDVDMRESVVADQAADRSADLRAAIDRVGYYPAVVADAVESALGGESVISYVIHHEPTFDHDEVRRHVTVLVLTPSRVLRRPHRRAPARRPAARAVRLDVDRGGPARPGSAASRSPGWSPTRPASPQTGATDGHRGRADGGVGCRTPGRPRARDVRRPRLRRRPRLHRHAGGRGLRAADQLERRRPRGGRRAARLRQALSAATVRSLSGRAGRGVATTLPRYGSGRWRRAAVGDRRGRRDPAGTTRSTCRRCDSYVVFLVDGLGWNLLRRATPTRRRTSPRLLGRQPLTCGVPSTTATSLTSLGTGLPPGAHGVVGFTSRIPGTDRLLDALRWDADVDPREWQRARHGRSRGRASPASTATVVSKRVFQGSGLTEASQRGAIYVGADTVGERISGAVRAATEQPVAHLRVRRRARRDRSPPRLRVVGVGAPAGHGRQLRGCGCARRCPSAPAWSSPATTAWSTSTTNHRIDVDEEPELMRRASACSAARRASDTSTATTAPSTTWPPAGASGSVTTASCSTRDDAIDEGWFGEVGVRGPAAARRRDGRQHR